MDINFDKVEEQYHLKKLTIIFKKNSHSFNTFGTELRAMISGKSEGDFLFVMTEQKELSRLPFYDIEAVRED